jgi:hypothetical protein
MVASQLPHYSVFVPDECFMPCSAVPLIVIVLFSFSLKSSQFFMTSDFQLKPGHLRYDVNDSGA